MGSTSCGAGSDAVIKVDQNVIIKGKPSGSLLSLSVMSEPFPQHIVPLPQPDVEEVLVAHQVTYEFYAEVRYRADLECYCQWYEQVAEQHQRELAAMRSDINILGWFVRRS